MKINSNEIKVNNKNNKKKNKKNLDIYNFKIYIALKSFIKKKS